MRAAHAQRVPLRLGGADRRRRKRPLREGTDDSDGFNRLALEAGQLILDGHRVERVEEEVRNDLPQLSDGQAAENDLRAQVRINGHAQTAVTPFEGQLLEVLMGNDRPQPKLSAKIEGPA